MTNITTTSEVGLYVSYKKRKRTAPTITLYDRAGNSGKISRVQANVAWTDNITPTINTSNDQIGIPIVSGSGSTATGMGAHYTADAEL